MLKTTVLMRQITNLSDARYAAGMGVEMLGFCIDPSHEAYVSPQKFEEIIGWIAGGKICVEIQEAEQAHFEAYKPDCLLLGKSDLIPYYRHSGLPLLLLVNTASPTWEQEMIENQSAIDFFVIETNQQHLDLYQSRLVRLAKQYSILLSPDFQAFSPNDLLNTLPLAGFALKGSPEDLVGDKDFSDLATILEALETE